MSSRHYTRFVPGLFSLTAIAIRGALSRRDAQGILVVTGALYLLLYLWGLGHLGVGSGPREVIVVDDPLSRMTQAMAPFQYEPVAFVSIGGIDLLVAPVNLLIGLGLGVLVGVNLAVAWVAWRGPQACRIGPGAGAIAGLPAILSGFACCGPTLLLVLGMQATAATLAAFQWFLPLAVVLLIGTLLWVGRHVDPSATDG